MVYYKDPFDVVTTALDERCVDAGGLCGDLISEPEIGSCPGLDCGCFDGIDNDCNGFFDGDQNENSDPLCCPDGDGDNFSSVSIMCHPDDAIKDSPPGNIDCNDNDRFIFPGAEEICDNARYPSDYPISDLRGQFIDNNCSGINKVTASSSDDDDPACCVDNDGDDFGDERNYVSCPGISGNPERLPYDCNDADPDINPNVLENTIALCTDNINNNCRVNGSGLDRIDHIDMYANTVGIAQAFTDEIFDPECCNLTGFAYNPNLEVCDDADSLLNNNSGSDENCNGLEGMSDHYCLTASGLMFHDNFTSNHIINLGQSTASHDVVAGTITISPVTETSQIVLSNPIPLDTDTCSNVLRVTISHNANIPANTNIDYEVSNDGSDPSESITVGVEHIFATGGNTLRWKATLTGNGVDTVPTLNSITLSYTCN